MQLRGKFALSSTGVCTVVPALNTHFECTAPLQLIVATGKARGPWTPDVLPQLGAPMPGVFLQVWRSPPRMRCSSRANSKPITACERHVGSVERLAHAACAAARTRQGLLICDAQGRTMLSR